MKHRFVNIGGVAPVNAGPMVAISLPGGGAWAPAPGGFVDIDYGQGLMNTGLYLDIGEVGTSAQRPVQVGSGVSSDVGRKYYDTTINKAIFWDGAGYRDYTGAAV